MNRSQRRLKQLQETVQMKFALLAKQKDDIKEVVDDYVSQVVLRTNQMLSNELDLMQNFELYDNVLQNLDKASQVLTKVTIQLDSILDMGDGHSINDENVSESPESGGLSTMGALFTRKDTKNDIQQENSEEELYAACDQQLETEDHVQGYSHKQPKKGLDISRQKHPEQHVQDQQENDRLEIKAVYPGSEINNVASCIKFQGELTESKSEQVIANLKSEQACANSQNSGLVNVPSVSSPITSSSTSLSSSSYENLHAVTANESAETLSRLASCCHAAAHQALNQQHRTVGNAWVCNCASESHLNARPLKSLQWEPSIYQGVSCSAEPFHYNVPHTHWPVSFANGQYGPIMPVNTNSVDGITVPYATPNTATDYSPGYFYGNNNFYNPVLTRQPAVQQTVVPHSLAALLETYNNSLDFKETPCHLLQDGLSNGHLPVMNTVTQNLSILNAAALNQPTLNTMSQNLPTLSQDLYSLNMLSHNVPILNIMSQNHRPDLAPFDAAAGPAIPRVVELASEDIENLCSQSEVVDPAVSISSSSTSDHSNLMSSIMSAADPVHPISNKSSDSLQPYLSESQDPRTHKTLPLTASEIFPSDSRQESSLQKSLPRDTGHKSAHRSKHDSQKKSPLPKSIRTLLHSKRTAKKPTTGQSLQGLIREVQAETEKKTTVCGNHAETKVKQENVPEAEASILQERSKLDTGNSSTNGNLSVHGALIQPIQLDKDSISPAVISSMTHPWSFHVQLVHCMPKICALIKHSVDTGALTAVTAKEGMLCLATFNGNTYYRAQILSIQEKVGHILGVKVVYIDYGLIKVVSPSSIYAIPDYLIKYPCQAVFCALCGVSPKNADQIWTEDAILQFQQCTKDIEVLVRVVHPSPSKTGTLSSFPHIVDILFKTSQPSHQSMIHTSMAEHLIEGGFARGLKEQDQIAALGKICSPLDDTKNDKHSNLSNLPSVSSAQEYNPQITENRINSPDHPANSHKVQRKRPSLDKMFKSLIKLHKNIGSYKSDCAVSEGTKAQPTVESDHKLGKLVDKELHFLGQIIKNSQQNNAQCNNVSKVSTSTTTSDSDVSMATKTHESAQLSSEDDAKEEMLVIVSSVISPSSFFVHRVDSKAVSKFAQLEDRMRLAFEKHSAETLASLSASFQPARNTLVCASHSENGCFYRGLLLHFGNSCSGNGGDSAYLEIESGMLLIFFIDYGDFEWVSRTKVYPLPDEFRNLTPLVLWFTLSNVIPQPTRTAANGEGTDLSWSADAVNKFKSMVCGNRTLYAVMTKASLEEINIITSFQPEPVPVFLLDKSSSDKEMCINYELIQLGLASPRLSDIRTDLSAWDPMTEEYNSIRNSYKVNTDEAGVALLGYTAGNVGKEGQKVCVFFNRPMGCRRGDRCPHLHQKVDLSSVAHGRVPVKIFDEDQIELQVGSAVAVTVSLVITPNCFYVTLSEDDSKLKQKHGKKPHKKVEEETLQSMMENMKRFYSTSVHYDGDLLMLSPGQAAAAKVHGRWIRVKVIDTDAENGLIQVMSVDYGNMDWVDERNIRDLGLQFMHLTPQAIKCSLGLEPINTEDDWMKETCDQFAEMLRGKTLTARIKYRYPTGHIRVILYSGKDNLNQKLVDSGLAQWPAERTSPRETRRPIHKDMVGCVSG